MHDLWRVLGYRPHRGQRLFHDSDRRFKLLVAGARFGKSLATAREMVLELAAMPLRGWIVAPSYALARPEFRFLQESLRQAGHCASWRGGGREGASSLVTCAGAEVWALSAGAPENLLGEELDWLLLCEAAHLPRDVFERYLRPRLGTRLGRLVAGGTPRGSNWLHELYLRAGAGQDWLCLRFATWDNPGIAAAEIESARALLPPEVFDEQYGAEFTGRAGRVYPQFQRASHVRELQPPPGALLVRGLDFGFTSPSACVWLARDGQDRLLVLRELYAPGLTMDELARAMAEVEQQLAAPGLVTGPAWADPAGALQIETLRRLGVDARPAENALAGGIDLVRAAMAPRPDGTPGLLVDPRCVNLLRELEGYRWQDLGGAAAARPLKGDDHCLDALRYAVVEISRTVGWQSGPRIW